MSSGYYISHSSSLTSLQRAVVGDEENHRCDALTRATVTATAAETRVYYFNRDWRAIEERVSGVVIYRVTVVFMVSIYDQAPTTARRIRL